MFNLIPEVLADDPYTVIDDTSDMLCALQALIANAGDDLSSRERSGTALLLRGVIDCLDDAKEVVRQRLSETTIETLAAAHAGDPVRRPSMLEEVRAYIREGKLKEGDAADVPAMTARDTAIVETYRKGYEVDEIARAVNLKKQTVQKIIERLRAAGDLPEKPDGSTSADDVSRAASA
ncbi:MAG: helix-turn-helix domain-containing protein [Rhodospirillaceae bacterium]|nr:MAG: helix-turn-helix domain-containing protein [Rhodospirillaceae bacterium]